MKVIINKILPIGKKYYAINLFGILFAKGPCSERTMNHERIHSAQMKETFFIFFYLLYVLEWLVRIIQYRDSFIAYQNISFEREAYQNQLDFNYLKHRQLFSFLKYLNLKTNK